MSPSPIELQSWLQQRTPFSYRSQAKVSSQYALEKQAFYHELLKQGRLRCEHVVWHVTNRCNLSCLHCGVRGGETVYEDLSIQSFAQHIPELLRLGVEYITLSGGEPLVRKDISTLIELLKYSGFKVAMVTNGHYLSRFPEVVSQLDSISISIDGLAQAHNLLRDHNSSYQYTLEALHYVKSMDVPIRNVNTCVTPDNLAGLRTLAEEIFKAGANHWVLRPVALAGRAEQGMQPDLEGVFQLLTLARELLLEGYSVSVGGLGYLENWDGVFLDQPYVRTAGWNSFYILPNGDIKGFNAEELPLEGNLREGNLRTLWETGFQFYRTPELPQNCLSCEHLGRCNGGNLAEAESGYRCVRPLFERFRD